MNMITYNEVYSKAIDYLSRREYSYKTLKQKLIAKFGNSNINLDELTIIINQVLTKLLNQKLLSDQRFIQSYLNTKSNKYGINKIKYDLYNMVDDEELINQTIESFDINQFQLAHNIWNKKFGKKPENTKDLAKQIRFMQSRGFNTEIIKKILK